MAEVDGGGLSFKAVMDNDQMNSAMDETLRRVQGLSDGTVAGGKAMDTAFNSTADNIRKALSDIGTAIGTHEQELQRLESEYQDLGQKASKAFMEGRDDEYRAITQQQNAIKGEITVREHLIKELQEQSNKWEDTAAKMEENRRKTEENATAQVSMRTRIKELREEMMLLIDQGIDEQSEAYKTLQAELGRLIDIQGDVAQQGRMLANDEQKFQGIITGLSGLAGGFSAVTGAMSLFGSENEDLQKVMTKVQSVMAITIGMQQVAQALNKDSAFQLVTLNGLKEWWRNVVAQATVAETAETAAIIANTEAKAANAAIESAASEAEDDGVVSKIEETTAITEETIATVKETAETIGNTSAKIAQSIANKQAAASEAANTVATGGQAAAATAGTVANIGLAGAFRLVGAAIKSIPVFGWILAGIAGLISLYRIFSSKAREAKKAQEEFNAAVVEGSYKSIGSVQNLSAQWTALGNNLDAKKKFIEDNKKAFDELGVSIRDVADAENLLVKNKDAFIDAQIAKAKALATSSQTEKWLKQAVEADLELEKANKTPKVTRYYSQGMYGGMGSYEIDNPEIKKAEKKKEEAIENMKRLHDVEIGYLNEYNTALKKAGDTTEEIVKGTISWYEQEISKRQIDLKTLLPDSDLFKSTLAEITEYQKLIDNAIGKKATTSGSANKDPFLEKLEKYRKEYTQFNKWINSGDDVLVKAANKEFEGLLKQGATYIDYLKKQRDIILSVDVANRTKAQNQQLRMLNDQIAEETKKTVLEAFNQELSDQLNNAKTTLEILNIIAQKRKELANDGTDLDNNKKETLDDAEKNALAKQKQETDQLLEEYSLYLDKKIKLESDYNNNISLLKERLKASTTSKEKDTISNLISLYEQMRDAHIESFEELDQINADSIFRYGTFEEKRLMIVNKYEKKINAARIVNQKDVAKKLEGERDLEILKESKQYQDFFGDISELSLKTLENTRNVLLSMMKAAYETGKLTAEQYKQLIEDINKQADSAYNGRGIEAIFGNSKSGGFMNMMFGDGDFQSKMNSFKTIFSGAKGDMATMAGSSGEVAGNASKASGAMKGAANGGASTLAIIDAIIKAVYQTLKAVSDTLKTIAEYQDSIGNSDSADTLGDWADVIEFI